MSVWWCFSLCETQGTNLLNYFAFLKASKKEHIGSGLPISLIWDFYWRYY